MAAKWKGGALAGSLGKRLANQIRAPLASPSPIPASRHFVSSSYDKNVEEQVRPAVVPDDVIEGRSDKYWGPHPTTGVFGPADPAAPSGVGRGGSPPSSTPANGPSALDQKVWFRPLEDVDKPPHA